MKQKCGSTIEKAQVKENSRKNKIKHAMGKRRKHRFVAKINAKADQECRDAKHQELLCKIMDLGLQIGPNVRNCCEIYESF